MPAQGGGIEIDMRIGNIETENNFFLAPMAGVTDLTFRRICRRYGCGLTYTEMVSAKGLYYKDKKTASLMQFSAEEKQGVIQLFGSEPEIMAAVAYKAAENGAAALDINMGCPTPKIVNNGDGSALMKNPELAGKITEAAVKNAGIPVTVKLRTGWNSESINVVELARVLEQSGAAALAVHGRTREQFYSGTADWEIIKRVKESVSVPVIGNGDAFTPEAAVELLRRTGCDAVMIGRGAQGNPFIFRQLSELSKSGIIGKPPSGSEKIRAAIEHVRQLAADKGEERGIKEARKHISWYIKGLKDNNIIKTRIFALTRLEPITALLEEYEELVRNGEEKQ